MWSSSNAPKGLCRSAADRGGSAHGCEPSWLKFRSRQRTPGAWHQAEPDRPSKVAALPPRRVALARRRAEFFLKLNPCRLKNRSTELSVVCTPRSSRSRRTISASVKSGSLATSSNNQGAWASSGERLLPARRRGLTLPVLSCNSTHRIADEGLTSNRSAAARREHPAATAATTRARRSVE